MANNTIPTQPAAISLNGTEQLWAIQSGSDCRITTAQIVALGTNKALPWPVSVGGTGDTTFTADGVLYGNGASALGVTAAGTTGQVLTATTSAPPSWTTLATNAGSQSTVASPTFPSSTSSFLMQGLAGSITPTKTGNVVVTICGTINAATATTVNNGVTHQLSYGTGTAPTSNVALTGTQIGLAQTYTSAVAPTAVGDVNVPFSLTCRVTGLSVGTAYWLDLAAKAITTASEMGFVNVVVTAMEH